MGEETTQMDLTDELDRLAAMRGESDDGPLRIEVHDAVLDPDDVTGRRIAATAVEGPADLRGRRWEHPLDALHAPHVTASRENEQITVRELVDAVGGPDLDGAYVLDRETYVVGAVEAVASSVRLRVIEAPERSGHAVGDGVELARSTVEDATVAGYRDRSRYAAFDRYGRETSIEEIRRRDR